MPVIICPNHGRQEHLNVSELSWGKIVFLVPDRIDLLVFSAVLDSGEIFRMYPFG